MTIYKCVSLAMIAIAFASAIIPANNKYTLSTGYIVTIHGTSNLHDWDETVGTVTGAGIINWNSDGTFDLDGLNIDMGVHSIKSTEGSIMNNNTYKALKADGNPNITFALITPVRSISAKGSNNVISTKVNLSIAGVTKAIDMTVSVIAQEHGAVVFEGSKTIRMTDFGIKPPVALLGALKTGDNITIHFKTSFAISN